MIWVATQSDGINRVLKNSIAKYIPISFFWFVKLAVTFFSPNQQ